MKGYAFGIRLSDCSKLVINWKNENDGKICWHEVIVKFIWRFSYWSKFHLNIIIGSGVVTIFFHDCLTRNPEIGNTTLWVLTNTWRLVQVRDTKFGTNMGNEILLNAAKYRRYSFYCVWVIKGKLTGRFIPSLHPD